MFRTPNIYILWSWYDDMTTTNTTSKNVYTHFCFNSTKDDGTEKEKPMKRHSYKGPFDVVNSHKRRHYKHILCYFIWSLQVSLCVRFVTFSRWVMRVCTRLMLRYYVYLCEWMSVFFVRFSFNVVYFIIIVFLSHSIIMWSRYFSFDINFFVVWVDCKGKSLILSLSLSLSWFLFHFVCVWIIK